MTHKTNREPMPPNRQPPQPPEYRTVSIGTDGASLVTFTKVTTTNSGPRFAMKIDANRSHVNLLARRSALVKTPASDLHFDDFETAFRQHVADYEIDEILLDHLHVRQTAFLGQLKKQGWSVTETTIVATSRVASGRDVTVHDTALARDHLSGVVHLPASGLRGCIPNDTGAEPNPSQPDHPTKRPVVFTSLPLPGYKVIVDVVTPHEPRWHAGPDSETRTVPVPNRQTAPVPVPGLAIERGARFRLVTVSQPAALPSDTLPSDTLMSNLTDALRDEGFGAHTSRGCGYFDVMPGKEIKNQ
jgi:CRISPR/Cas system CMR subunit Cmr6 (Cas7 group RAMP superfamily)